VVFVGVLADAVVGFDLGSLAIAELSLA
jgi:hypothetical protein